MLPARRHSHSSSAARVKGGAAAPREVSEPRRGDGGRIRRVEERPALAMVAAPAVGLLLWAGLFALIF